jgi:hypothetical protein
LISFPPPACAARAKATNTTEPDGNGINPNDINIARLGEEERGPSVVDQRHRAVITFSYNLPYNITAGTVAQLASSRPFNSTTGIDNNGDGVNNDRPVIDGNVISKSAFRGTPTSEVAIFAEGRIKHSGRAILLRAEVFNLLNRPNCATPSGRTSFTNASGAVAPDWGRITSTVTTSRQIQLGLKLSF